MVPRRWPPALYRSVRQLRKGGLTYGEFGRRLQFKLDHQVRVSYLGYATKPTP